MTNPIQRLLNSKNYDIRKSHDARFMDQKVTPDVLTFIADCALNFAGADLSRAFTTNDIWNSQYFQKSLKILFNKPDALNPAARHEYDKFIQQPLKMLSYAGVLSCTKTKNTNYFTILEPEVLLFIASNIRNAFSFLSMYIVKVLEDSNQLRNFERFKNKCEANTVTRNDFLDLKNKFEQFIIGNTSIKGKTEVRRIFPKVLNVYATDNVMKGTVKGRLSEYTFYYTDLMYNRTNWRDINKDKNLTRKEAAQLKQDMQYDPSEEHFEYLVQKAKRIIQSKYQKSEVRDQYSVGVATHVHHIFPESEFPKLSWYLENLIKLTPSQHLNKAHPNGNTSLIDRDYQRTCLIAKSESIESSLRQGEHIYSKESFVHVINVGLTGELPADLSFRDIRKALVSIYS